MAFAGRMRTRLIGLVSFAAAAAGAETGWLIGTVMGASEDGKGWTLVAADLMRLAVRCPST